MSEGEASPFKATADYEESRLDYYQTVFDKWIGQTFTVLWDDYRGRFGILIAVLYLLMGTVGPILVPAPELNQGPRLIPAFNDPNHILGTDGLGQDMLALMVHATPAMMKMIISGAIAGNITGIILGIISGYKGGLIDKAIMTWGDTIGAIPGLPLLIVLAAIIQPRNPWLVGVILNIQGIAGASRGMRAQVLPLAEKEHVESAVAQGRSLSNIMLKEILPHLLPLIFIGFLGGATGIVTGSVGLYFLGVLPFTVQNWGVVLNYAYQDAGAMYSMRAIHWLLVPLFTIVLLNLGLTLLAQAFDQVFNPRVRARHRRRQVEASEFERDDDEVTEYDAEMMGGQLQR